LERTNTYMNNIAYFLLMLFAFMITLSTAIAEFILAIVLLIWIAQNVAYRRRNWLDYPLFKPIAAIVGFQFIVLIAAGYSGSFWPVVEQLCLPVVYFIVPSIVVTAERRRKIAWLMIAGAIVAASVGMTSYYLHTNDKAAAPVTGYYDLSIYLTFILGIVLSFLAYTETIKEKLFLGLVSLPLYVGVILALNRAAYLVTALFTLALAIFKDRRILLLVAIVAGISYLYAPQVVNTFEQGFNSEGIKSIISYHELRNKAAVIVDPTIAFFGAGINDFRESLIELESSPTEPAAAIKPGIYTETLIDSGPAALVFLIWLFIAQARYSSARFRKTKEPEQKMYQLSFLILIFCFMITGAYSNHLGDPKLAMLFWFYLGLSVI
jgi:hypothetical protein